MLQSGELRKDFSPRDRERFEAHLRECPYCVTYLEQMRATLSALGAFQSSRSTT
ncbi:MAG: zf-HC2 domain-containing protein [Candidatus Cybelea sp.]